MLQLDELVRSVGYLGIGSIVFAENGLLIGFFLPGDSLLFTAGFLASQHLLNIWVLTILVVVTSIVGTQAGYIIGKRWGRKLFDRPNSRFFKKENVIQAENFYLKHGGKTIVLARFIPVIRTFAPIVAGIGNMSAGKFLAYNIAGGVLWASGLTLLGYWLGAMIPNIDHYLLPVIGIIILLSILPGLVHMLKTPERRRSSWNTFLGLFRRS